MRTGPSLTPAPSSRITIMAAALSSPSALSRIRRHCKWHGIRRQRGCYFGRGVHHHKRRSSPAINVTVSGGTGNALDVTNAGTILTYGSHPPASTQPSAVAGLVIANSWSIVTNGSRPTGSKHRPTLARSPSPIVAPGPSSRTATTSTRSTQRPPAKARLTSPIRREHLHLRLVVRRGLRTGQRRYRPD